MAQAIGRDVRSVEVAVGGLGVGGVSDGVELGGGGAWWCHHPHLEAIILKASVASETCSVELKGGRRFTVDETQEEAPAGAVQPRKVTLAPDLDDDDEAAAVAAAERLPALVEQWETVWNQTSTPSSARSRGA